MVRKSEERMTKEDTIRLMAAIIKAGYAANPEAPNGYSQSLGDCVQDAYDIYSAVTPETKPSSEVS